MKFYLRLCKTISLLLVKIHLTWATATPFELLAYFRFKLAHEVDDGFKVSAGWMLLARFAIQEVLLSWISTDFIFCSNIGQNRCIKSHQLT